MLLNQSRKDWSVGAHICDPVIQNSAIWVRFFRPTGTCPCMAALSLARSETRLIRLAKVAGMLPNNWLLRNDRYFRLVKLPRLGGTTPLNWLYWRLRSTNCVRLPNSGGMRPLSWLDCK